MNNETFEQLSLNAKAIGDNAKWLLDQAECIVTTMERSAYLSLRRRTLLNWKLLPTGSEGDTAGTGGKPAHAVYWRSG